MLVCGASDFAVDIIRDIKQARVGRHGKSAGSPQRTGDREVCGKAELSNTLSLLAGSAKGQKGKKPRGEERRKLWESVKDLRKE